MEFKLLQIEVNRENDVIMIKKIYSITTKDKENSEKNAFNKRGLQILLLIIDLLIIAISGYLSLTIRFMDDGIIGNIPMIYMIRFYNCLPIDMAITVIVFFMFKLYHCVWTYVSINEVIRVFEGIFVSEVLIIAYRTLLGWNMPRSVYIINAGSVLILVLMSRVCVRVINYLRYSIEEKGNKRNTMIIGAGAAGSLLLKELIRDHNSTNKVVCFIDKDPNKKGKYLNGIKIFGDKDSISEAVAKYNIQEIMIAMPSAPQERITQVIKICNRNDCQTKILPPIVKTLGRDLVKNLRDISYEDLLERNPVVVDQLGIYDFITGKTILITGGGGSIGSELCRQIIKLEPRLLIIFDIYENNAYDIQMELIRKYPNANIRVLIGSVRDMKRMDYIFKRYKPDVVYHAAAHKHVPLMEESPNEAIKNNCGGTLNMVKLSHKYGIKNFVLISTDKAVRPTNLMGASKRICEMIVQSYAKKSKTKFAAVRFGNVLGSNGSVIPLFLKQIENGGPVTVTHREITRFFMTIPEAVLLVLQAGMYAKGGEIFVLDMGKQVKIYDLAENLIKMQGYKPHEDIKIEIVGLRPGEKLYEEILMDEEGMDKTENKSIFIGKPIEIDEEKLEKELELLIENAYTNSGIIKEKVEDLCGTYTITNN